MNAEIIAIVTVGVDDAECARLACRDGDHRRAGVNPSETAQVRPPGGILAALRFGWNVLAPIQLPRATTQQAQPEQQLPEQR